MTAPLPRMTPEEYLAFERASEGKHEYVDGYVYAMSGARRAHVALTVNLIAALRTRLRGGHCRPYSGDMRVGAGEGRPYFYPDVTALCGRPEFADGEFDTLLNPSVIVEVLSDSTEAYDRGDKFAHYQAVPSLREYVLVSQHEVRVDRFVRGEGGAWVLTPLEGLGAVLELPSVGCAVPLAELYEDVELPARVPGLRVLREAPPAYAAGGAR